jgi:hypothetical protein
MPEAPAFCGRPIAPCDRPKIDQTTIDTARLRHD